MECALNYIIDNFNNKKLRYSCLNIWKKYKDIKNEFIFSINDNDQFSIFKWHIYSNFAIIASLVNLYNIRQLVLKYSIYITQSKNIKIIRFCQIPLFFTFYILLFFIWQIPSITVSFSLKLLAGISASIQTLNIPNEYIYNHLNDPIYIEKLLNQIN